MAVHGRILLSEETFTFNGLLAIPDYCTLEGQGPDSTHIFMASNSNTYALVGAAYNDADHVTIKNLSIDHNGNNQTAGSCIFLDEGSGHRLINVKATNGKTACFQINDASDVIMENCFGSGNVVAAQLVQLSNVTNGRIINFHGDGGLTQGIFGTTCTDIQVIGGDIRNLTGNTSKGVNFYPSCTRCTVLGVTVVKSWCGIANCSAEGQIIDCQAYNIGIAALVTGNAFDIDGARNAMILGCTAHTVVEAGLCAEGVGQVVANNTVELAGIGGGFLNMKYGIVKGNTIKNSNHATYPYAIWLIASVGDTCHHNIVEGNICFDDQITPTQTYGIYEGARCDDNEIKDNILYGNVTKGIYKTGASTKVWGNKGYVTENHGVASNVTLNTSGVGVIVHSCDVTPTFANVICQDANLNVRPSSIDTTNINLVVYDLDNTPVTADTHDFYWEAK